MVLCPHALEVLNEWINQKREVVTLGGDKHQQLIQTPVTKLCIGEVRFRRELAALGCQNIVDIFNLPLATVDEKLSIDASEQLDKLRAKYEKDPEAFAAQVLPKPKTGVSSETSTVSRKSLNTSVRISRFHAGGKTAEASRPLSHPRLIESSFKLGYRLDSLVAAPTADWFRSLRHLDCKARDIFDDLGDRHEVVMVHMAFDELAVELDGVRSGFRELFAYYRSSPREAIELIKRYLGNVYLVYLADRARDLFDGDKLWPYVFGEIGVTGQNAQIDLKKLFVDQLGRWPKMPCYAENESDFYYLYTTLMHGGLSEGLWEDLWKKSILPFCRQFLRGSACSSFESVALDLLDSLKDPESRLAPNSSVRRILQKVPDATLVDMLSSALGVATRVIWSDRSASSLQVLSSNGLPDTAMVALKSQLGRDKSSRRGSSGAPRGGLVYIPEAELSLDLGSGKVLIAWPALALPQDLAGCIVEYMVNGESVRKEPIQYSVNKSLLKAVEIPVCPSARYIVELKLARDSANGQALTGSLRQSIQRSRPGCFEFIQTKDGLYRLRGAKERLTKSRRIAYLVEEELEVVPIGGMTPGSVYGTDASWGEARVQVFTVEPGASGKIVDRKTGDEVAIWHESYRVHVSKDRRIGKTLGGLDLFGESPDANGFNGGLPLITISGVGNDDAFNDLDVECTCDGQRVSIARKKKNLWREDGIRENMVLLDLAGSNFPGSFVECCEIIARQKSTGGVPIYRYKFALAPIRGFHLDALDFSYGILLGTYRFKSACDVRVSSGGDEKRRVSAWCDYTATVPLSDESLLISMDALSGETTIAAKINLAAIDVRLPKALVEISKRRPICLHDALELSPSSGMISMSVSGWRVDRAALMMLGNKPLFYEAMETPGKYAINLFGDLSMFVPDAGSAQMMPLSLWISSGSTYEGDSVRPASADAKLFNCCEGIGFHSWELFTDSHFKLWMRFDAPVLRPCSVRFFGRVANKLYGEVALAAGDVKIELPQTVTRALSTHHKIRVSIVTADIFGGVDDRYPIEFSLGR